MDVWFKMFFLLMLSVGCTSDSTFPTYHEGDVAILKFQYNIREITANETIQICRGNRHPFYIAGNISQAGLHDNEVGRFSVQEGYARDVEGNEVYMIVVTIQNVTSNDGGSYICSVHKNGQILGELDQRIGLTVHFPPRKASCHFMDNAVPMNKEWINLECTASRGSYFGFFDCYQDDKKMSYLTRPIHNYIHITQTMLVRANEPVVCCSTSYERPKKKSACTDFSGISLEVTTHHTIEQASHVTTTRPDQHGTTPTERNLTATASVEVLTKTHRVNATDTVPVPYANGMTNLALSLTITGTIILLCVMGIAVLSKLYYRKHLMQVNRTLAGKDKYTLTSNDKNKMPEFSLGSKKNTNGFEEV